MNFMLLYSNTRRKRRDVQDKCRVLQDLQQRAIERRNYRRLHQLRQKLRDLV